MASSYNLANIIDKFKYGDDVDEYGLPVDVKGDDPQPDPTNANESCAAKPNHSQARPKQRGNNLVLYETILTWSLTR